MKHICDQVALLGCLKSRGNRWSASWLDRCNWSMNSLSFICGWLTLRCSRRMTLACLESEHGYWLRTRHTFPIWWWTNTFIKYDFHDETTKWKIFSCYWSSCCFPNDLKYVGTDINRYTGNEIAEELCSSKIDEGSVRQWKVGEHDQLQSR